MADNVCKYCGSTKIQAPIEGGALQYACAGFDCPGMRYDLYAHGGGCGIRSFAFFQNAAGEVHSIEVPNDFVRPENWDGKPPLGFTPPLSFAKWQEAGEPKSWNG